MRRSILLLPFFIFIAFYSFSQDSASIKSDAEKNTIAFYHKYIGKNSSLYKGSEYDDDFSIKGHPYFESDKFQKGSVRYSGTLYDSIDMAFDIAKDELVILRNDDNVRIRLVKEKIDSFTLLNHLFVKLVEDSNNKFTDAIGFCERLYHGKMNLYAKRKKSIIEKIVGSENEKWFEEKDFYFVQKGGSFISVQKSSELFDLLSDRKKEVKEYLRKNNIKFNKAKEQALISAIAYYDQLKNPQ